MVLVTSATPNSTTGARVPSPPRFFEQSEDDFAKKCMVWLLDKGYVNISFTDPRLSYFEAQIDAALLPGSALIDGQVEPHANSG